MNFYNDIDPNACAWISELISAGILPPGDVDNRSITEIQPHELAQYTQCHFFAGIGGWSQALNLAGWEPTRPVWTGSCPCQPLSVAGLRKGHADERHLWPTLHRLIAECRPPVIFGEQVASKDGREWMCAVRADMEGTGYAIGAGDLCSSAFGVSQTRERLFFVADAASPNPAGRGQAKRRERRAEAVEAHWGHADWRKSCEARVLDDGIPNRVAKVLIKGFGNAIVPQVAAEFVMAYDDISSANTLLDHP